MEKIGAPNLNGIQIANAAISEHNDLYIDYMYTKLKRQGHIHRDCVRAVKNKRNVFAACLLACGHGDALVAGITRNFNRTLKQIMQVLSAPRRLNFWFSNRSFRT